MRRPFFYFKGTTVNDFDPVILILFRNERFGFFIAGFEVLWYTGI